MKRRVVRAALPYTVPTLGQIAAALFASAASTVAGAAHAEEDAGSREATLYFMRPKDVDASSTPPTVDGQPVEFESAVRVQPGQHKVSYNTGAGVNEETLILVEGEVRNVYPVACAIQTHKQLGGVPPHTERARGCCGTTSEPLAKFDLRAFTVAAAVIVAAAGRRRKPGS